MIGDVISDVGGLTDLLTDNYFDEKRAHSKASYFESNRRA